jgi:NHL repeat
MLSRRIATALSLVVGVIAALGAGASPALAETHPFLEPLGGSSSPDLFANPNGIAVDESTGDVYVADLGSATVSQSVSKFDPAGKLIESWGTKGQLTGPPAKPFSFPTAEPGNPAAIAVDNSASPSDPSRGDLYVLDAGHEAIDKFKADGSYIGQIPFPGRQLLGVGVQANGALRVYDATHLGELKEYVTVFDNSAVNSFVSDEHNESGFLSSGAQAGFAVSPAGDGYLLNACGCLLKYGQDMQPLGQLDSGLPLADVAVAVDAATGHVYVDDQSAVTEWDTGAMNGLVPPVGDLFEATPSGAQVSSLGSLQLSVSTGQGGIAVNGTSGNIYVSDPGAGSPGEGKVYVYASDAPGVAAGAATDVTQTSATLQGTVDPRGVPLTSSSCVFEYEGVPARPLSKPAPRYGQSVPCEQTATQIGSGDTAVPVTAKISGLVPGRLYDFRLLAANGTGPSPSSGRFAAAGPGFGVRSFGVSFLNQDGTPDTQAGSHPYQMVTSLDFNTRAMPAQATADSPYVTQPDGHVRDVIADLPPGLVGDPNATAVKCKLVALEKLDAEPNVLNCPPESQVGELEVEFGERGLVAPIKEPVFNMVPPPGVAAQIGADFIIPDVFIDVGVHAGGDYPLRAITSGIPGVEPLVSTRLVIFGVVGTSNDRKPFLTLPTACNGPLRSSVSIDSWEKPGHFVQAGALTRDLAGQPLALSGCSKLLFPPTITVSPDTTDASTSSGLTVGVHVPQNAAFNPAGLGESDLRDTTVALPAGVAINPSGGSGLEACSEGLAGFEIGRGVDGSGFEEFNPEFEPGVRTATFTPEMPNPTLPGVNFCPNGSKIGTVKVKTPLLEHELEGEVYLASQNANPFGSLLAMYMIFEDPVSGSIIKLTGEVRLCGAAGEVIDGVSCQGLGQIVTTFKNTPDLPFENLELHFFGGERAPLATPSRCGTYTTTAVFTPWDGNGPVTAESSFNIEHGPQGGPCPGGSLPFSPTVNAGATNIQAGAFSPLTVTVNRKDGEQNLKSLEAKLPPGLSGVLTGVELCPEPQANEGLCGEGSKVGEATIGVGVGNDPFTVTGGKFYLTGPYNGNGSCTVGEAGCAPFGLTFEVPAKAGPFDLANTKNNHPACDCVVVRGKIELNSTTSAITITSNPPGSPDSIPTSIEGIPLEIQHVNATTTRGDFQFNPTNCSKMALTGTVQLNEGGSSTITTPFQVTNCASLKFEPKFSVSTSAKTSRTSGASLTAKLTYPNVPQGTDADIAKVKVELPKQLPSRLTTLQKACSAGQFEANPAGCPAASKIGYAIVHTPLIPVPLQGPAIFVSHGGEGWPSLVLVLQGYGITIDLTGSTLIKNGITSTTFKTVPDQPFSSFELTLPEGPYSALTATGNLCAAKSLTMPTEFIAQNGAQIKQITKIAVTGCPKAKKTTHKKKKRKAKTKHKRKRKPKG